MNAGQERSAEAAPVREPHASEAAPAVAHAAPLSAPTPPGSAWPAAQAQARRAVVEGRVQCYDPTTLRHLGDVPCLTPAQVNERVARARAAAPAWARTPIAERRRVLRELLDLILAEKDTICHEAARDSGKTLVDAAMGELFPVCEKIRYLLAHGAADLAPERRGAGILMHKKARVEFQPLGVIGVLCPWNFPFHNIFCPLMPALFAGNAVVAKASEWTSRSASYFEGLVRRVLRERGHSEDLVQVLTGDGETGAALVRSGVDKIFFTGSPQNGRRVMTTAAESLTPVVLELGGKDAMIICEDADLEQAASSAMLGVFTACGQMCVAAERLYVFDGIYHAFVDRVLEKVRALRQGPPLQGEYDVGAMTMPGQLAIIQRQVDDAVAKGAKVLCGGRARTELGGQFYEPTVIVNADHRMAITREETFGPVMVIMRVGSDDQAIRLANESAYGLGSSVFTRDLRRADRYARELSAGMTVVNDYGIAYMASALPFGGVRISGFGRINGREGLRACCNEKAVVTDRFAGLHRAFDPYPVTPATRELLYGVVDVVYGGSLVDRARGAARTARSLVKLARG